MKNGVKEGKKWKRKRMEEKTCNSTPCEDVGDTNRACHAGMLGEYICTHAREYEKRLVELWEDTLFMHR